MITTTLNRIRAHSPCRGGWAKLLRQPWRWLLRPPNVELTCTQQRETNDDK